MKTLLFLGIFWVGTLVAAYFVGRSSGVDAEMKANVESQAEALRPAPSSGSSRLVGGNTESKSGGNPMPTPASNSGRSSSDAGLLNTAINSGNPIKKLNALTTLLEHLGPHNIDEALDAFEKAGTRGNERELSLLMYAWAKFDGPAALAYLEDRGGRETHWSRQSALNAWATADPDAAIAYAKEKGADMEENYLLSGVINGLVETDLPRAGRMVYEELPYGRARGQAARKVVDAFVEQGGIDSAKNWLNAIPDGNDFKNGASAMIAGRMAADNPEEAAGWVMGLAPEVQRRGVETVASEWSEQSPETAAKWVDTLPENVRAAGMEGVVSEWARKDSKATAEWLNQYPASPDMDEPVKAFAYAIRREDPESAVSWASSITDEAVRNRTVNEVVGGWVRRDRDAAKAYFQNSGEPIPDQIKRRLRIDS